MKAHKYLLTGLCVILIGCGNEDRKQRIAEIDKQIVSLQLERNALCAAEGEAPTLIRQNDITPKSELDRELASALLTAHHSGDTVNSIQFTDQGITRLKQQGFLDPAGGISQDYIVKPIFAQFVNDSLPVGTRIRRAYLGNSSGSYSVQSPVPMSITVGEISGIAMSPLPNICEVHYVVDYQFSAKMASIKPYIFTGAKRTKTFHRYDDGWRITR